MLAVITGASGGIGAAFARQLAASGWDLLLIARREDRLRALARYFSDWYKVSAEALPADLTDPVALSTVAARVRQSSDLGLMINNAGFATQGYFFETDPDGQQRMHRLHVDATVALTHAALANLVPRARKGTGVINVSSIAGFGAAPQNASYCATKAWMNTFTEAIAIELASTGSPVTAQALCPGYTLSEFHDVSGQDRSAIPMWLWMPPDSVVAESLRGFEKRKTIVVPGWRYKLGVTVTQLLPAGLRRRATIAAVRRYRKKVRTAAVTERPE